MLSNVVGYTGSKTAMWHALLLFAGGVSAEVKQQPLVDKSFYDPSTIKSGIESVGLGYVAKYETENGLDPEFFDGANAYRFIYKTTGAPVDGKPSKPVWASAMVMINKLGEPQSGWNTVAWAHGTVGIGEV